MRARGGHGFRGTERFAVLRKLGAGGMGEVYEALDRERDMRVALKTLRRLDAGLLYRLKAEFRALQNMHHPNLVGLGELIEADGDWFFTMELIDGVDFVRYMRAPMLSQRTDSQPTLAEVPGARREAVAAQTVRAGSSTRSVVNELAASTLDLDAETPSGDFDEERLRVGLAGMVEGLCALHHAGMIHRDIKPSNIMVTGEGRVVLLDFGLVQETVAGFTEPDHHLIGTPAYMAPEQAETGAVSAASDWYSLGVTLYQAMTGVLPFRGGALEVMHAKRTEAPERPSVLVANVPADLDALCMELLMTDPADRPDGDELRRRVCGETGSIIAGSVPRGVFVGRGDELAELRDAFDRVSGGEPVAVYVKGMSGVGKTALVHEFLARLRREQPRTVILSGRCYERESVPFKALDAVVDSLNRYLRRLSYAEVLALLPEQMPALARVFPVLGEIQAISSALASAGVTPEPQDLRGMAFAALKELFVRIADQGVLVVYIDDLQWGDADSAALLAELMSPPRAPSMLLLGAFRSDEPAGPVVAELSRRLAAHPARSRLQIRDLQVTPLSFEDARRLALSMAGEAGEADEADEADGVVIENTAATTARAEAIARESAGNPFFLGEMMRSSHADSGSIDLFEIIRRRVRELPEDARTLLEVIAVVGRPVERGLVLRAARMSIGGDGALAQLRASNFIRTGGSGMRDRVEFFHDRIRETVAGDIEPARLHNVHQRIAAVLGASDWVSSEMLALAIKFAVGADRDRAFGYALESAERAEKTLAFERASRLYGLAMELSPAQDVNELRVRCASALANAGHSAESAEQYLAAAAVAAEGSDERLDLTRRAADNLFRAGHVEQGLRRFDAVAGQLGIRLGKTRRGILWSIITRRARLALIRPSALSPARSDPEPRDLDRLDTLFSAASALGMIDNLRGTALQSEHLLRALKVGDERRVCRALEAEAVFLVVQRGRKARRGEQLSRELLVRAERSGDPFLIAGALMARGIVGFFTGRYPLAYRSLSEAERMFTEDVVGASWERNTARYWLYMAQISMGDLAGVAKTVERAIKEAEQRNDFYIRSLFLAHPTVWYLLREDRPEDANSALDGALDGWPEKPYYQAHYVAATSRAMVALYQRNLESAAEQVARAEMIARPLMIRRMPYVMGELHKIAGQLAILRGDHGEARRRARHLAKVGAPVALGLASLTLAPVAYARGDDRAAERALTESIDHLEECRSAHLAAAARFRLGQLRAGPRGEELRRDASRWMRGQGVANIEHMVRFLAPGFDGEGGRVALEY